MMSCSSERKCGCKRLPLRSFPHAEAAICRCALSTLVAISTFHGVLHRTNREGRQQAWEGSLSGSTSAILEFVDCSGRLAGPTQPTQPYSQSRPVAPIHADPALQVDVNPPDDGPVHTGRNREPTRSRKSIKTPPVRNPKMQRKTANIDIRVEPRLIQRIDAWRAQQRVPPSRSAAIVCMIEKFLKADWL
jgi:hypothetical protein